MAKRGAPRGNNNARIGTHPSVIIRLDVVTTDLLCEVFALEGNIAPTREDFQNAVYYAIRQIYGKKQDDNAIII